VILHTKYPINIRASLRSNQNIAISTIVGTLSHINSDIWTYNLFSLDENKLYCTIAAPPSARRKFFKCAPPNLKSWIRPWERVQGCRKKNRVAYTLALNLVRSGTRSKYREIEREVVLDNHKQRCIKLMTAILVNHFEIFWKFRIFFKFLNFDFFF
jgi:hypothetical protein